MPRAIVAVKLRLGARLDAGGRRSVPGDLHRERVVLRQRISDARTTHHSLYYIHSRTTCMRYESLLEKLRRLKLHRGFYRCALYICNHFGVDSSSRFPFRARTDTQTDRQTHKVRDPTDDSTHDVVVTVSLRGLPKSCPSGAFLTD